MFNLKNVITENKAVADHEGYLKLILSEGNVQDNRLAYAENGNKYVLINTTSLDKYFEKQSVLPDIVKIDVLKLNCEGCEWQFLNCLDQELTKHIQTIIVEIHGKNHNAFLKKLKNMVSN